MTRKALAHALGEIAHGMEYCFYSGFSHRIGETIVAYPAMWLTPPEVTAVEGRAQGRVRYRVALQLMQLARKATPEQKEEILCALEEGALEVCRALESRCEVVSASLVGCTPAEFSLTNHGEISMTLKMDVEMPFCRI